MAALGLALLATTPSRAQTANWTGANSTDWFDFINNWAFGFPTAGTDVFIDTVNPNPTVVDSHVPGAEALKVRVGVSSTGMLTIQNGGTANFILSIIGDQSGSTGTVTVDGNGSTWSSIFFEVGLSGTGTLTIRNGAVVDGSDGIIGGDPGSTGTVTVDGAGSSWTLDFAFLVGVEGTGTLTIRNGGEVNFDSPVDVVNIAKLGGTGTINIGSASGQPAVAPGTLNTSSVTFGAGNGSIVFNHTSPNYIFAPRISGAGSVWVEAGTTILTANNIYTGTTNINAGTLQAGAVNAFSPASAFTVAGGAVLDLNNFNQSIGSLAGAGNVTLGAATLTTGNDNTSTMFSGTIGGTGGLTKTGAGTQTLSGTNGYTGATNVNGGTLLGGAANAFSAASATTVNTNGTLDLGGFAQTINAVSLAGGTIQHGQLTGAITSTGGTVNGIGGTASLTTTGGITTATGINGYTGATAVNAGALIVNGSIAASSGLTVDAGALVGGNGFLPTSIINGTLSPGNSIGTITVNGLTFGPGSTYLVEVSPTAADRTNVTGTATLNGTVLAIFAPGSYITKQYTILHANGGLGGTTFGGLATANVPTNFSANLGYGANDVFLNLTAALGKSVNGLNQNQVNVATAINGFFNNGGALPPNFLGLFNLTGTNLATALSQLSGEAATAAQYGAFQLGSQFFSLMLDPLVYGRGPGVGIAPGGGAMRLAAEETQAPEIALAYAKILKEPPAPPAPLLWERRWNVWAGGYGGTNRTEGDPVVIGSHDVTARTGGYGAGIDYRIWPGTTVGVALAGGFTNWGLASGLGGGNSDVFQAGLYGITRNGPAYLAGALAFAEHWMSTDRFAFAGDHLTARFNAQNYGGRLEGGWRFATFLGGVAPYAAVQAQAFHTPSYNELDGTLGGFGLNYNARNGSDTRSELGARFDQALPIATTAVLALNARAAWAHDWVTTPILNPLFQTLPGTLFAVTGATPVPNSALASAGAELRFLNGWALAARFDGEFADRAQTYAGTGTIRYVW